MFEAYCSHVENVVRQWTNVGINLYFVFDGESTRFYVL
jgi:hypothetical protein